jgi:hypothetical protein
MLHLLAQPEPRETSPAYAEAVSRLASVRHALKLVEPTGAGPSADVDDEAVAGAWDAAGETRRSLFDRRSARMIGAASAGIEAIVIERQEGRQVNSEASRALADEIRRELREIAGIVLA